MTHAVIDFVQPLGRVKSRTRQVARGALRHWDALLHAGLKLLLELGLLLAPGLESHLLLGNRCQIELPCDLAVLNLVGLSLLASTQLQGLVDVLHLLGLLHLLGALLRAGLGSTCLHLSTLVSLLPHDVVALRALLLHFFSIIGELHREFHFVGLLALREHLSLFLEGLHGGDNCRLVPLVSLAILGLGN